MKECIACGMPLIKPEDCAGGDLNAVSCIHCTNSDGKLKSCNEIFEGGVHFFIEATGSSKGDAEKLVRKNMCFLDHWKENPCECLGGEQATDEEYQAALEKL